MPKSFKPMLADNKQPGLDQIRFPVLVSPKLDGVRCIIWGRRAVSRKLIEIPNRHVQSLLAGLPEGLDGELMLRGGGTFNQVQSAVMSEDGEPDIVFNVFDCFESQPTPFRDRHAYVRQFVFSKLGRPALSVVAHELCEDADMLQALEADALAAGYEGVMLRDPNGPYKCGRSTIREGWLLKRKPFEDAEARIVGVVEQMHNANEAGEDAFGRTKRSKAKAGLVNAGVLGALICVDPFDAARTFEIGTGYGPRTIERKDLWDRRNALVNGHHWYARFKYQPEPGGTHEYKPRCPVFLGLRDSRDMGEPK